MHIIIAGGTGFIGQFMTKRYLQQRHQITIISRSLHKIQQQFADRVHGLDWTTVESKGNCVIKGADLIINLSGAGIANKRWSEARKQEIITSRTKPTKILAQLCAELGDASPPLFNASAIGIYGSQQLTHSRLPVGLDESHPTQQASGFANTVVQLWEQATQPAIDRGVRVVHTRFGVVCGKEGGALARLKQPFLLGLGGKIGSGQQAFSWICSVDLCRAIDFLFEHSAINGPVNIVSPNCVTQAELAKEMGKVLHRPTFIATPTLAIKLLFGQMGEEMLLNGQHVIPKILLAHGFTFQYPDITLALKYALQ